MPFNRENKHGAHFSSSSANGGQGRPQRRQNGQTASSERTGQNTYTVRPAQPSSYTARQRQGANARPTERPYRRQRQSSASVQGYGQTQRQAQQGRQPEQPEPRRRGRAGLVVGVLVLLLALGGGAALFLHFMGSNGSDSASTQAATKKAAKTKDTASTADTAATVDDPGEIVMGVNGSEHTIVLKGEEYLEAGAHAAEPTDGVLTSKIETTGTVDTSKAGTYTVTYAVSDSTGHRASIERTVEVVESMDKQQNGIPVLMYHDVHDANDTSQTFDSNSISTDALAEQLQYLTSNGFYFASFQEVKAFVEGTNSLPAKSIVLTFDDASAGFLDHGIPVIEQYQVPATSFTVGMDDEGNATTKRNRYVEFESHSYGMHQAGGTSGHGGIMTAMTTEQILEDLQKEAAELQANNAFAYPFGDVPDAGVEAVRQAGIACAFTTVNGWAKIGDDPAKLPRVRINAGIDINSYAASIQN